MDPAAMSRVHVGSLLTHETGSCALRTMLPMVATTIMTRIRI